MLSTDYPQLGTAIRQRRTALRLTLDALAAKAGCTKGYLSSIENHRRANPPGDDLLGRLEHALALPRGALTSIAHWHAAPPDIKRELHRLRAARAFASTDLDALYRAGTLHRLAGEPPSPASPAGHTYDAVETALPREVPLINLVPAGAPTEFTDLGYPARVADAYVRSPDIPDADLFAARVVGDSMRPEYKEGDIVVFSPARTVESGMDCFARLEPDQETTFKRVYFETGAGGETLIRLQPLNPAHPARVVERERVAGLYAAVSVTRAV